MSWTLATLAVTLLTFAAISGRIEGTSLTAPMVFTTLGLLFGADALGLVDKSATGEGVKLLAEATLTLVLFSDASRIDLRTLRSEIALPVRLLAIGLPLTLLAGFGAALVVLGGLAWPEALVLAVVLAPTDAALGQSVVTFPRLPSRVRQGLNVESGLNDGICVPLFFIALAVAQAEEGAIGDGAAARLVAEQIGYGVLAGAVAGTAAAAVVLVGKRQLAAPAWLQIVPLAGAGLAYGIAQPLGGSGFIAAFVGGLFFGAILE
jgi:NhaP-type Na+/H+ or K+/H+ antiporter